MEWTAFATDAISASQIDTWHLPVNGKAKANAKAKAEAEARAVAARAPVRHGNVKNLDALTHRNCPDTPSYALRASKGPRR